MASTRYARRRVKGLCVNCPAPARPGRAHCDACGFAARLLNRAYYEQRKADGICTRCGKPAGAGRLRCAACAAERKESP